MRSSLVLRFCGSVSECGLGRGAERSPERMHQKIDLGCGDGNSSDTESRDLVVSGDPAHPHTSPPPTSEKGPPGVDHPHPPEGAFPVFPSQTATPSRGPPTRPGGRKHLPFSPGHISRNKPNPQCFNDASVGRQLLAWAVLPEKRRPGPGRQRPSHLPAPSKPSSSGPGPVFPASGRGPGGRSPRNPPARFLRRLLPTSRLPLPHAAAAGTQRCRPP